MERIRVAACPHYTTRRVPFHAPHSALSSACNSLPPAFANIKSAPPKRRSSLPSVPTAVLHMPFIYRRPTLTTTEKPLILSLSITRTRRRVTGTQKPILSEHQFAQLSHAHQVFARC